MLATERHRRDLERVETVAEARYAKDGEPGPINARIRGGEASFADCEHEYTILTLYVQESGDIVLNLVPDGEPDIGVFHS